MTYHLAGLDPHQRLREECVVLRRGWEGGEGGEIGRGRESECERAGEGEGGWGGKGDRKQVEGGGEGERKVNT